MCNRTRVRDISLNTVRSPVRQVMIDRHIGNSDYLYSTRLQLEFTYKDHQDLLCINVLGLYFTAQLAAKQMIANKTTHGSIVLVASMASHIAVRRQLCSAYCGSKGAVRSMCPAIAKE